MAEVFGSLLQSGDFSGLTITCGEKVWKVHKAIICPQSDFFMKACNGGFMSNIISLDDDDPEAPQAMIHFLYEHRHDVTASNATDGLAAVGIAHIRINLLADKYDIKMLQDVAHQEFTEWISDCYDTGDFGQVVACAYAKAPVRLGLRTDIINVVANSIQAFYGKNIGVSGTNPFADATAFIPEFATDLILHMAETQKSFGSERTSASWTGSAAE